MRSFILIIVAFAYGCNGSSTVPKSSDKPGVAATMDNGSSTVPKSSDKPGVAATMDNGTSSRPKSSDEPGVAIETSLQQLVQSYIKAAFRERYKYVYDGIKLKDEMAKYYSALPVRATIDSVTIDDIKQVKDGASIVTATVKGPQFGQRVKCYVKKAGGQWLVDWPATVGLNSITLKTFRATVPNERSTLRVIAEFDDYYNFQYGDAKLTHFSISLSDNRGDSIHGYVGKESKIGKELHELLQDGSKHEITVAVQCTGTEGSVVEIVSLRSKNWFID